MATLFELKDEILKGRKFKRSDWTFFSLIKDGRYIGTRGEMFVDIYADDWELEPKVKKKITMYQVVYRASDDRITMSGYLYESEEAFIKAVGVPSDRIMSLIPIELEVEE